MDSRSRGLGSLERVKCSISGSSSGMERSSDLRERMIWVDGKRGVSCSARQTRLERTYGGIEVHSHGGFVRKQEVEQTRDIAKFLNIVRIHCQRRR